MRLFRVLWALLNPPQQSCPKAKARKKKNKGRATESMGAPSAEPSFLECPTPQQSNGYNCGLLCNRHCSSNLSVVYKPEEDNWFSAVEEHVTVSLELNMRTEVLRLIEELKADS